jgi:hypothetical protein
VVTLLPELGLGRVVRVASTGVLLVTALAGCAASGLGNESVAPAYFTEVTESNGLRYAHNWEQRPCFSLELPTTAWQLDKASANRVVWHQGKETLGLYLTDNRYHRFAVSGMNPEQILRAFIGYELEYIKPRFEVQMLPEPRFAGDGNGTWAQWRWEGYGGLKASNRSSVPADQHHVVASLWLDPWVLSLDWGSVDDEVAPGPRAELVDVVESLTFNPQCFQAMKLGETW